MPLKRSNLFFAAVTVGIAITAWLTWQWYEKRYPTWKEEVQLSDGRVILITQKHEYYENYGTNQSWITFSLPEMGGKRTWHSYLIPQRVDVYDGKVYVFGFPRGPRQFSYYRYPKNYMVGFMWNGTDFDRIPFLKVPELIRQKENVYSCIPNPKPPLLRLDEKNKRWCEPQGERDQFKREIDLTEYQKLADSMSKLSGGPPISE